MGTFAPPPHPNGPVMPLDGLGDTAAVARSIDGQGYPSNWDCGGGATAVFGENERKDHEVIRGM
jgi:hypothetical protein